MTEPAAQRADIQGMRAVAVGLVILGHAGFTWFPGGYIGVDVFFAISGFLITGILARSLQQQGRISIADFYARRARRILPASAVALVAISIASAFVYTAGRLHQVLTDTVWAGFFGVNLHYAAAGTGYFDNDTFVSPIRHFWSLAVEEQFYLVWPLLLAGCALAAAAVHRLRHRAAEAPTATPGRMVALRYGTLAIALLCVASLAWSVSRTHAHPTSAYFSTFTRGYELGIGALLALVVEACRRLPAPLKAVASWSGLGAIGVAAATYGPGTAFPGTAALLPVLGAALVLAGGVDGPRYGAALLLSVRPVRWIGDISYSLYLWHWPCLILPAAYVGRDLHPAEKSAMIGIAVLAAALSYRFIEQPFRHARAWDRSRLRALVLWPACLSLVLVSAGAVWAQQSWRDSREPGYTVPHVDPEPGTVQDSPDPLINDVGFAAELARAGYPLPTRLIPSVDGLFADVTPLSGYGNHGSDCFARKSAVTSRVCVTGDTAGSHTIAALGDSHMGMWLRPITELAAAHHQRLVPLLKQHCMPFAVLQFETDVGGAYDECPAHGQWVQRELERLEPDLIVVSALYLTDLVDPATGRLVSGARADALLRQGATRTLTALARIAPRVLVIGPTPVLARPSPDCLASQRATMATCSGPFDPDVIARDRVLAGAARAAGVQYLRMIPWFCDARLTCPIVVRDLIVYRDSTHITQTYAERLKPVFAAALNLR